MALARQAAEGLIECGADLFVFADQTNFRVRNCRRCQLKSPYRFGLLIVFFERRWPSQQFDRGGIGMNKKLWSLVIAAALALTSPAFARGGGGGMRGGGMGSGWHGGGMHFSGGLGGGHFARAGFSPGNSRFALRDHRFFSHHRFHRFAFVGFPYGYAAYDGCWRRTWNSYGPQWVNVCSGYDYY
jgi:hypothetical protein